MRALALLAVLKLGLRLELGPEYDSNANRAEVVEGAANADPPVGSALLRTTARGQLAWRKGASTLRLQGGLGTKVFFAPDAFDQTVWVGQIGLDERIRATRGLELGMSGDYYDATQPFDRADCSTGCLRARDFRSGTSLLRLAVFDGVRELTLLGGYQGFQFKPDPYFDFHAGQGQAIASARFETGPDENPTEWTVSASYRFAHRRYPGLVQERAASPTCAPDLPPVEGCLVAGSDRRADWFHEGGLDATYLKAVLIGLGYALQLNQSNSYGQSLLRHLITLKIGARLPWRMYLTIKAQLLVNSFLDPVLLDRRVNTQTFITIEDENRNALVLDLERPIGRTGLAMNARYSVYTNELQPAPTRFLRQTVYLGLTYRVNSR